jgi:hypothetical protein
LLHRSGNSVRGIQVVNIAMAGRRGKWRRSAPSTLNAMRLDRLHVVGPGNDLEIGLMPKSQFTGGSAVRCSNPPKGRNRNSTATNAFGGASLL